MADVTDTFQTQVVERSRTVPVVVDLWAEWCEPCRQLGPIIEKVVAEAHGAVELAKVDIESNPGVAQAFQVQSIPAVYVMVDGQVADGFLGAQSESAVREFLSVSSGDLLSQVEQLVDAGDEASHGPRWRSNRTTRPQWWRWLRSDRRRAGRGGKTLLERVTETPSPAQGRGVNESDEDGAPQDIDAELATLLSQVKADEDARQRFIDLLEVLGPDDPRTVAWRKRLSAALF